MLGPINIGKRWNWALCGKHPAFGDYLTIHVHTGLFKTLADWMEQGFQGVTSRVRSPSEMCSWRFWARGAEKQRVACGLLKDSTDCMGRPYPLLVLGIGALKGFSEHWQFLPLAFEDTWGRMEYITGITTSNIDHLKAQLNLLWNSLPVGSSFDQAAWSRQNPTLVNCTEVDREPQVPVESDMQALDAEAFFHPLGADKNMASTEVVNQWHVFLRKWTRDAPVAVFFGGTTQASYMAVFRRALRTTDFVQLWTICETP